MFEEFEHTADLGLRVEAASLDELFEQAGLGLTRMLVLNPDRIESRVTKSLSVTANDREYLLFDWLSELLYLFESEGFLCARIHATASESDITAELSGDIFDPQRHQPGHEVKAITYHGLLLEPTKSGWRAEVIVDI